ncbi:MAG: hypothetical protein FWG99_10500 [Treponema sp.]|nr:hypothetical protein [Treponema sp.]
MKSGFGKLQIFVLVVCALASVFSSCSRAKPEITYGFIELVYYEGDTKPLERFSFFIIPNDEDGIENLGELYLYHDREQLRWHIKSEDWVSYAQDETIWIGTRSIAIQDNESLPRGQFRAVLVNKGGESTERNFSFDGNMRFPFPTLDISGGRYIIDSRWPNNHLIYYDAEGNYISTATVRVLSGAVGTLNLPTSARTAALWVEDSEYSCSAFTNAVPLR